MIPRSPRSFPVDRKIHGKVNPWDRKEVERGSGAGLRFVFHDPLSATILRLVPLGETRRLAFRLPWRSVDHHGVFARGIEQARRKERARRRHLRAVFSKEPRRIAGFFLGSQCDGHCRAS